MNYTGQEINILIFKIMNIKFGVSTDQLDAMVNYDESEKTDSSIFWLHERIDFYNRNIIYQSPKILMTKDINHLAGIIVDEPEDIISLNIDSIMPLPTLFDVIECSKALWGCAMYKNNIILLVDFFKL
ncbi:MAG: hypothetical protein HQK76_17905 [Desulfobacterales bacterium]|nr:hypothetical protein [Desulfobacterales bacterium]